MNKRFSRLTLRVAQRAETLAVVLMLSKIIKHNEGEKRRVTFALDGYDGKALD